MNSKIADFNWDLVRAFLAVMETGSLSGAARKLALSQPTLTRAIQNLEKQSQTQLFLRSPQGLTPTDSAVRLHEAALKMDAGAEQFLRQIAGVSELLEGSLRISANEIVGLFMLPPALTAFRKTHPQIQFELVISNQASSLHKREADIALRMFQPTQPSLIARQLPDLELGFYAHRDYIKAHGEPQNLTDLRQHTLIGYEQDLTFIEGARQMGIALTPADFAYRCDHLLAQIQLARAGAGIIGTHSGLATRWPEMQPITPWLKLPPLPFWIVSHGDTQYSRRVRTLTQFLADWFTPDPYANCKV